jgi:protein arginine N-methyltransferase 3
VVRGVSPSDLLTEAQEVASFDLATMAPSDQDFTAAFRLEAASGPKDCHALVLWFDTLFTARFCGEEPVELGTGPYGPQTHWAQTVLVLPAPVALAPACAGAAGAAVALAGRLSMARREGRHRCLDISVEYAAVMADGSQGEVRTQLYSMGVGGTD